MWQAIDCQRVIIVTHKQRRLPEKHRDVDLMRSGHCQASSAIGHQASRYLERQRLLERDAENSCLAGDDLEASPMEQLLGSSITYRIAVGPQQGSKVFTLQTLPACDEPFDDGVGKVRWISFGTTLCLTPVGQPAAVQIGSPTELSLHAGVAARAIERKKLERAHLPVCQPARGRGAASVAYNEDERPFNGPTFSRPPCNRQLWVFRRPRSSSRKPIWHRPDSKRKGPQCA